MKIPATSIQRLSLYYRALLSLRDTDVVSSQELADLTECSAAQIRKDLAYFGQFGTPGFGYPITALRKELKGILGIDRDWTVALVGVGDLGSALLGYRGFRSQRFYIRYAFDNDKNKINRVKQGVKIRDIAQFKTVIRSNRIDIAIVAVSREAAHGVIDRLVSSGIKAIFNFAPVRPKVPAGVRLLNMDLSMQLETLAYFLKQKANHV